jgi:hypothetical protein
VHSELRNFGQYVRSLYPRGAAVAGSFVVTALLWAMDKWNPPWWKTSPSWSFFLLFFIITQYLAWRDVWLKMEESGTNLKQVKEAERERDIARGERDVALGERNVALGERDALQSRINASLSPSQPANSSGPS